MKCNCKWTEIILAIIIGVFAYWPALIPKLDGKWIVLVAALVLLIHGLSCKGGSCHEMAGAMPMAKPSTNVRKKRR